MKYCFQEYIYIYIYIYVVCVGEENFGSNFFFLEYFINGNRQIIKVEIYISLFMSLKVISQLLVKTI